MSEAKQSMEQLFEEYQRKRATLSELHQKIMAISVTAASARREIEVTVNHAGSITGIVFTGSAYRRMAPKELADLILRTVQDAKERSLEESAGLLAPIMPNGMDAHDLVSGRLGIEHLVPADGPRLPQIVRERLEQ